MKHIPHICFVINCQMIFIINTIISLPILFFPKRLILIYVIFPTEKKHNCKMPTTSSMSRTASSDSPLCQSGVDCSLLMECEEEELSVAQINFYQKYEIYLLLIHHHSLEVNSKVLLYRNLRD